MRLRDKTGVLRMDLHRMITSPRFFLSILAGVFVLLRPLMDAGTCWTSCGPMELLAVPLGISDFTPFAVLFCVFPFSGSFCEDMEVGNHNHIAVRSGCHRFALYRCVSVSLSGGMVMSIIMGATVALCVAISNHSVPEDLSFMANTMWARTGLLEMAGGLWVYLLRIMLAFLFGCVWASAGLAVSVVALNRYVTVIGPFALYQFLWFTLEQSPFNPVYLLRGDSGCLPSLWFIIVLQSVMILLFGLLSYQGIMRRIRS